MTTPNAETAQVNRLARILMSAWEHAEGKPVTPSYVATFADMARAVLVAGYRVPPPPVPSVWCVAGCGRPKADHPERGECPFTPGQASND